MTPTVDRRPFQGCLPATRWEYPFWLAFLYWSLAPSRMAVRFDIAGIPIDSRDLCLIALAMYYTLPFLHGFLQERRLSKNCGSRLVVITGALVAYAALSVLWSPIEEADANAMLFTLLLFIASVFSGYMLVQLLPAWSHSGFLRRSGMILALVCAIYSADSFLELGLRTPELMRRELDFGIARVSGPLFGASSGYFLIVPALAGLLQDFLSKRGSRIATLAGLASLGVTLFALGSRGGILIAACFVVLGVLWVRDVGGKLLAAFGTTVILLVAAGLVWQKGEITRVGSFEDRVRFGLHESAYQTMSNRPLLQNLAGSGYGSVWPWYRLDDYVIHKQFDLSVQTSEGWLTAGSFLYHPHSVLLLLGVELGLAGMGYLLWLAFAFAQVLRRHAVSPGSAIWACGLVASSLSLLLDLFLFYRPRMSVVWWVWVFISMRRPELTSRKEFELQRPQADAHYV